MASARAHGCTYAQGHIRVAVCTLFSGAELLYALTYSSLGITVKGKLRMRVTRERVPQTGETHKPTPLHCYRKMARMKPTMLPTSPPPSTLFLHFERLDTIPPLIVFYVFFACLFPPRASSSLINTLLCFVLSERVGIRTGLHRACEACSVLAIL